MRKSLNLGSPVRSATGADETPSEHWHLAIWNHTCMVSDAFPSLVSRIVAISSIGCSLPRVLSRFHHLTDRLLLPPSAPSFPPRPHIRDDDRKHCVRHMSVVACGFNNNPSVSYCLGCVCSLRCLSICVAHQMAWPVGCQAIQVDGTIPLEHACPFPQP